MVVKGLLYGLAFLFVFFIIKWISATKKAMNDPDVKAASELHMSIIRYKKYKEIFDEQVEYARRGKTPPNRLSEIKNMNEWRRYGDYRLQKQKEDMLNSISNLHEQ